MKAINLHVSIDDANLILEALGNLPFAKVYALIGNLQAQASQQLAVEGALNGAEDTPAPTLKE
jgi:hypothetical protein